jgi:ubiquinone/menaquinone biosynthesis C-methylase UbiE
MMEVYERIYVDPRAVQKLDRNIVVRVLLFGQANRLLRAYLNEIPPGSSMWQVAHVYGDQVIRVAQRIGPQGSFDLTDVTPVQVEHACKKLAPYPWAKVHGCDAAQFTSPHTFDVVGSFFLLHEVPEYKKRQILDNMLNQVAQNGKAVFIDYHQPRIWHPVRPILNFVNAVLEPFARSIWDHEISEYATRKDDFIWTKRTFFGGVYQCTVAQRKA